MNRKRISVVVAAFNEEGCVEELARRLTAVFDENPAYDFEVIVVENGSTDRTWELLEKIYEADSRFRIVQLARNFRMDGGITAGLEYATGDAAVIMVADLQDPPELITEFIRKWEEGIENVYMVVSERRGTGPLRRLNSRAFYWLSAKLTGNRIPRNASDFRLVDRSVYEVVRSMGERNRFVRGLFAWVGFKSAGIEYPRSPRYAGESKAHTLKVIDLASKGLLAFSYIPLRLISALGAGLSALSALGFAVFLGFWIASGDDFAGYGAIVSIVVLGFGLLISMLGIVAEYLGLVYEEVKQRPNFVVRQTLGFPAPSSGPTHR